jgi:hypothetical protein
MTPIAFWRAVLCLDANGRPLGGVPGKLLRCRAFKTLEVTGIAHHPYTRGAGQSPFAAVGPEDVILGTLSRLTRVIDLGAHLRRLPGRVPIYLTEYGFQTNPPDRFAGVPPSLAAEWLNESDWIAYNNPRVQSVAQYELRDERPLASFQTGLRFSNGRAKPLLGAYRLPLWVVARGGRTTVWGQVRAGGRGARVDVLIQPRRGVSWRRLTTVRVTNGQGYLRLVAGRSAYRWRLSWTPSGKSKALLSRVAAPAAS